MKTDSESQGQETIDLNLASAREEQLIEKLRPRLDAIVEIAELLKTKAESDKNVQAMLSAARGLLDVIDKQPTKPRDHDSAPRSAANEQCDVLHIEDDSLSFAAVKLLLGTKRKLTVLRAHNGNAGIALAQTHRPKLILLDLNLPDIHGSEVIERLQKSPATAHIPVVVVSGDATASQIERLLVLGARNYLTKPFEPAPFLAVIDEVMQESAAVRTA
jgi:CheY-like chemotaxis protein